MSFNKTTGKLTTTKTAGDIVYLSGSIYEVLGMLEGRDLATSLIHPYMLNLLGVKVEGVLAEFQSGKLRLHGAHERDAGAYISVDVPIIL
jgi:hypothetical protein